MPKQFLFLPNNLPPPSDIISLFVAGFNCMRSAVLSHDGLLDLNMQAIFVTRWAILRCLRYHYKGDLDRFVSYWGFPIPIRFFSCTGRGPKCPSLITGAKSKKSVLAAGSLLSWDQIDFTPIQELNSLKTTEQKLDQISSIYEKIKDIDDTIPSEYSEYVSCIIMPIMQCYRDHCGSSTELFKEKWGDNFKHKKFGQMRCPGPEWRRAGQTPPTEYFNQANYWQLYVMRHYGQVWPADKEFDINRDLSATDCMTVCGAEFGNFDWESEFDLIPDFTDLRCKSIKEQLAEVRRRYERFQHEPLFGENSLHRKRTMRRILDCLNNHYGGDEHKFENHFPNFYAGSFYKMCHGEKGKACKNGQ
jgi:hypothetical protein